MESVETNSHKVQITDTTLRDGDHAMAHQFTIDQVQTRFRSGNRHAAATSWNYAIARSIVAIRRRARGAAGADMEGVVP